MTRPIVRRAQRGSFASCAAVRRTSAGSGDDDRDGKMRPSSQKERTKWELMGRTGQARLYRKGMTARH